MSSEWTVATLKEYVDQRFTDAKERVTDAKRSTDRAEDAATESRKYADLKSNEFRGQLEDQAKKFMPRTEAQAGIDELRRFMYVAMGLGIAAGIVIPILLR